MHPNNDPFARFTGGSPFWGADQAWHFSYEGPGFSGRQRDSSRNSHTNEHPNFGGLFDDLRNSFQDFADAAQDFDHAFRAKVLLDPEVSWDDLSGEDPEYMLADDLIFALTPAGRCGDHDVYLITSLPELSDSKEIVIHG